MRRNVKWLRPRLYSPRVAHMLWRTKGLWTLSFHFRGGLGARYYGACNRHWTQLRPEEWNEWKDWW